MLKMSINVVTTDVANLQITGFCIDNQIITNDKYKTKVLNKDYKLASFFLASQMLLNSFRPTWRLLFCLAAYFVSTFANVLGELAREFRRYAHSA
jgi:hypothetical protein